MLVVISAAVVLNQTTQTASLHHWFDLFRSLDPPAKPFFRLQRRLPLAKFSNIRFLKESFDILNYIVTGT